MIVGTQKTVLRKRGRRGAARSADFTPQLEKERYRVISTQISEC